VSVGGGCWPRVAITDVTRSIKKKEGIEIALKKGSD
jgi:hypothetical protein